MKRIIYHDDACTEINYEATKQVDDKYYPISYATEKCGCNAATGKCHTAACQANDVTFYGYDLDDKTCQGKGDIFWNFPFNQCKDKMILHNKAAPGYKDPHFDETKSEGPKVPCDFKHMARVFYKDPKCTEIDFDLTK